MSENECLEVLDEMQIMMLLELIELALLLLLYFYSTHLLYIEFDEHIVPDQNEVEVDDDELD
jgi:hypothetical protein